MYVCVYISDYQKPITVYFLKFRLAGFRLSEVDYMYTVNFVKLESSNGLIGISGSDQDFTQYAVPTCLSQQWPIRCEILITS